MGLISSLLSLFGCGKNPEQPMPEWTKNPRKQRSEAELQNAGIPINSWLPLVDSEEEVKLRTASEIAKRANILMALIGVADGGDREAIIGFLKNENLWSGVTPNEKAFFENENPPQQSIYDAIWRSEALWVLLWSLGKIESLDLPQKQCDVTTVVNIMPHKAEVDSFIQSSKLRSAAEILDEADKICRIHWAVRDAQINGKPIPAELNPSVVVERHYALNWLIWYADEWDDITTDT